MITIDNIERDPRKSRGTPYFRASICLGGKKIGIVKNDGNGSRNVYKFDSEDLQKRFVKACADLPPLETDWGPVDMDPDLWVFNQLKEKDNENTMVHSEKKK